MGPELLGAFTKLREAAISFVMSVPTSDREEQLGALIARIFIKFDITYFPKICRQNSRPIKIWQE